MAVWFYGDFSTYTLNQSQSSFYAVSVDVFSATEAVTQSRLRGTYTAKNLSANVDTVSGTATIRTRKNGGNGGQTLSFSTTGFKEDTTGTDSLVSGDLLCYQMVAGGSHGNTVTAGRFSTMLDDGSGDIPVLMSGATWQTGTQFHEVVGDTTLAGSTEADTQVKVRAAMTTSRFRLYCGSNASTTSTTFRTRKNGANGGQSVSLSGAATGEIEDTTGTDSLVAGDLYTLQKDSGNDGTIQTWVISLHTSAEGTPVHAGSTTGFDLGASLTRYYQLRGPTQVGGLTTEATTQFKARVADDWKFMSANVIANSRSDATTANLRANAANPGGGPSISISAAQTGIVEDLSGSYTSATTDNLNYRVVTGAGTGTLNITILGVQQGVPSAPAQDTPESRGRPYGDRGHRQMTQLLAQ